MNETQRRRHPRIPLAVEMLAPGVAKPMVFVSRNLSIGGVLIESAHVFPLGSTIDLHCKLPYAHGELHMKGHVVRYQTDSETGLVNAMAIEFKGLGDTERKALASYLENTAVGKAGE